MAVRKRYALERLACERAVSAGLALAEAKGWPVTIAIVDDSGTPVHLSRMDEASAASIDGAIAKARSAALTGFDTDVLEKLTSERPALITMGRVAVEGGIALRWDGQRLGGIGVSGVQSHQDAEVARATSAALLPAGSE